VTPRVVAHRYWTIAELVEKKLLPRRRLLDAVRTGALPVAAGSRDDDVLVDLAELDRWLSDERFKDAWVDEWLGRRGASYAAGTRRGRPLQPKGV
jgi:hypothetical protein